MSRSRPNILLIVSDQQRPDLVGALGRVAVQTPALDRLCREGAVFTRAYTPCPLCTPARASMITGQYPSRHGAWSIGVDTPDDALSVAALLREQAGYRTALIGKSNVKSCLREGSFEALPRSRDWDVFAGWDGPWFGFEAARINVGHVNETHAYSLHYGLWLRERGVDPDRYFDLDWSKGTGLREGRWDLPAELHVNTWTADQAIAQLRTAGERPFFLSVNFPDPHSPFLVPAPWDTLHDDAPLPPPIRREGEREGNSALYQATLDNTIGTLCDSPAVRPATQYPSAATSAARTPSEERKWKIYMGMTSFMDQQIGRILDALDELGLADDTLVVFTSDHGDMMGDHWLNSKGASHYDGSTRVPFIVRQPGVVPAGERSASLQCLVDLAPTFLKTAGLPVHPAMQGVDQSATWARPDHASRAGVLVETRLSPTCQSNSWITPYFRLSTYDYPGGSSDCELFDLTNDPDEFDNIADTAFRDPETRQLRNTLATLAPAITQSVAPRLTFA